MKHPLTASFAIVLIAVLLISGLPSAQLPIRLAAAPAEAATHAGALASPAVLAPSSYDILHHAAPSTPWTAFAGRGVNAVLGNFVQHAQDLAVPGRVLPLAFTRTYNSASTADGPLGPGWTHSYNLALIPDGAAAVLLRGADGRLDRFLRQADGSYVAPTGLHSQLTAAADGTYALRTKGQTVYRFDASGRLVSITDRNANAILLGYGGGDLTGITDTVGRTFVLLYNGSHHLTELRDPTGRTVRFTYHPDGRLASVIDPLGHVTSYSYTGGYLTSITDANGNTPVSNTCDAQGRVTEQRDALGNATTFTYDWNSGQTTVTGPRGDATVYTANAGYRVTAIRDASGYTTTTAYDAANNRISATDRRGATSSFAYDARGNLIQATDAAGGFSFYTYDAQNNLLESQDALGRLTAFTYDARGNRLTATDPLGQVTIYGYDSHGQVISTTDDGGRTTTRTYDGQGNMISQADALGQVTGFGYDALGRMTSRTAPTGAATHFNYDAAGRMVEMTDAAGYKTTTTYDAVGNRTRATDKRGNATTYVYDAANRLTQATDAVGGVTRYTYDADGNRITVTDAAGAVTTSEYDLLDRQVRVTDPLGNASRYGYDPNGNRTVITDTLGQVTTFTYDALNRMIATTDPLGETASTAYDAVGNAINRTDARGNITHYEYDALNRLVAVTDAAGGTVRYYYDSAGNRTAIVDAKGSTAAGAAAEAGALAAESQAGAAQYIYDAGNRLAETVDPLGNRTRYTYDAAGNLTGKTDALGQATTYEYDALGRLVKAIYPDNTITYHYDAAGNRTHVIDIQGVTIYEYDARNRVVRVTDPAGQAVGYAYDALGRRTRLIYPDGRAATYTYDARGRMKTVTDWDGNATGYTYNARGQLSRVAYPNGASIEYGYDAASHLTDIVHRDAVGQILLPIHYDLDANGNRVAMSDNRGTESYTYDGLDRLARVVYADGETVTYTYDEAGNRLAMESSSHGRTTYEYNVADQLLRMTAPDSTVTDFAYDANGNMIRKGSVEYLFDGANRLTQVIDGENWVAFTYDGDGHRLSKTAYIAGVSETGQTTTYATDVVSALPQVIAEVRGGQAISYTYGLALNSIAEPGAGWRYYHADGLGSVRALSGAGGGITADYRYDVFGAVRGQSGMTGSTFTYTGQQFDEETGLFYLRARYFDPGIARFISRDTFDAGISTQVANRYIYAHNDPVNYIDPTGHLEVVVGSDSPLEPIAKLCKMKILRVGCEAFTDVIIEGLAHLGASKLFTDPNVAKGAAHFTAGVLVPAIEIASEDSDVEQAREFLATVTELSCDAARKLGIACGAAFRFGYDLGLLAFENGADISDELADPEGTFALDFLKTHQPSLNDNEDTLRVQAKLEWCNANGIHRSCFREYNLAHGLASEPGGQTDTVWSTYWRQLVALGQGLFDLLLSLSHSISHQNLANSGASNASWSSSSINKSASVPAYLLEIMGPKDSARLATARYLLRARTTGPVQKLQFLAYYAADPNDINTVAWRHICWAQRAGDTWTCDWDLAQVPDQGNAGWGTVVISAHYYTCNGAPGSSCDHVGDHVRVEVDRGALAWDFGDDSQGWRLVNGGPAGFDGSLWRFEPGSDPQLVSPDFVMDAGKYNAVEVVLDSRTPNTAAKIYFTTRAAPHYSEDKMVRFTLVPAASGAPRAYTVHLGSHGAWQGIVTGLRIDPVEDGDPASPTDFIAVDKISFRRLEGISRTDWVPDGSLIKGPQEDVFLVGRSGATSMRRPIPSAAVFESCGYNWNQILYVSETLLEHYPIATQPVGFCDGAILKGSGPEVYFIENGKRRHFCSGDVFTGMGYRWESIRIVPDDELNAISAGDEICTGWTRHPDGTQAKSESSANVYLIQGGQRRLYPSEAVFRSWAANFNRVIPVAEDKLASYPQGTDMSFRDGALIKGGSPDVFVVENRHRRLLATAEEFERFGYRWSNVIATEDALRDAVPLGHRLAPDPLLATVGLKVTPDWPAVGKPATATFTLKNTGNYPITLQALRADVAGAPFPTQAVGVLQPDETASYSQAASFEGLGTYQANAQHQRDGAWITATPDSGQSAQAGFTVMMIAAPVLNAIDNPEQDGTFSVTWSAVADATSYLLEEDDDPAFGSPSTLLDGNYTRWPVEGPLVGHLAGTFYYRVKVMLPYESGPSNWQSTIVRGEPVYKGWHPDSTLLKRPDHPEVMLLENGKRRPFANQSIYFSHYPDWKPVGIAQSVEYDRYEAGEPMTFRSGTIIKEPTLSAVYAIDGNAKRHFCSASTYLSLGYLWDAVQSVPAAELPTANGPFICLSQIRFNGSLVMRSGEGDVYRIENGQKRLIINSNAYLSQGYNWSEIAIIDKLWQDDEMASYPAGPAIAYRNGTIIRCPDEAACPNPWDYWVIENGLKRRFPTGTSYEGLGYHFDSFMALPWSEISAIPDGPAISEDSLHVNGAFVKDDRSADVYLVENGYKRLVPHLDILRTYGWGKSEGKLFIPELHAGNYWRLDNLPRGADLTFCEGSLLSTSSLGMVWAIEGGKRRPFQSEEALNALGYARSQVLVVDAAPLALVPEGAPIALKSLLVEGARVRGSDGRIWRLDSGQRRWFPTWNVYYSWGYQGSTFAQFADAEVNSIPQGANIVFRDGAVLRGEVGPDVYVVVHGQKRRFPSPEVFLEYGYEWEDIQLIPDSELDLITTGPDMDIGAPTPLSAVINGGAATTSSRDVTIRVHATDFSSGVRYVYLSNDHWASITLKDLAPAEGDFWRDIAWTLSSGDGRKTVWIRFCDTWDALNYKYCSDPDALTAQITLATPPPTGQYVSPAADALVRDEAPLEVSVTDTGAGIRYVEFTAIYGGTTYTLTRDHVAPYQFTWNLTGVPDEANIVLGGTVMDNLGRDGAITPRTIAKDRTAPSSTGLEAASESAAQFARRLRSAGIAAAPDNVHLSGEYVRDSVTLSLDAADNLSGVGTVQFSGYYGGAWHAIGTDTAAPYDLTWNLSGIADGPIRVKAIVPDNAGNSQELPEVRVVKDTVAPGKATGLRLANRGGIFTNEASPAFAWNAATDDRSGVAGYFLAVGDRTPDGSGPNDWAIGAVTTWAISATLTDGAYRVALTTFDRAGNVNPPDTDHPGDAPYFDFVVDTAPPSSAVQPLAAEQTDRRFNVTWAGSDNISGVTGYDIQFREGSGPWLNWLVDVTDTSTIFTGEYDRQYAFRARAHDRAGNVEAYGETPDAITRTPAPQPAAAVAAVQVSMEGAAPRLRWQHSDLAAHRYEVWRGTSPYFTPGVAGSGAIRLRYITAPALGSMIEFTDTAVSVDGQSYYAIVAVNAAGTRSAAPARSGLFRFSLTPGQ